MSIQSINPFTGKLLKEYDLYDEKQIEKALSLGQETFQSWRKEEFKKRKELMLAAAAELQENQEEYALLITREMGKVIQESRAEIEKCAWVCEYYAEKAEEFLSARTISLPDGKKKPRFCTSHWE